MAERGPDTQWYRVSYAQLLADIRAIGQVLLDLGLSEERPLLILSGNSIAHAVMALGAQYVGVPSAAIAPAYALVSDGYEKLKSVRDQITPGAVFAENMERFAPAVDAVMPDLPRLGVEGDGLALSKRRITLSTSGVVLPMAVAIFRFTGPCMNIAVAVYVAHVFGISLGPSQYAAGIAAAAITTMGAVSLPGQISFVSSIAPIAIAMGVPIEPLALLVAVETMPDLVRTIGNVTMDVAVTTVIARRVGGEMTDRFIDTMIFDMRKRSSYPRLSIAGASGGNLSDEHLL